MEASIFWNWLQWGWIAVGVLTFLALLFITAPYGRHTRSGWGPLIEARVGWVIMEVTSPLFLGLAYFGGLRAFNPVTLLFVLLWMGHYVNRSLLYPLRMKNGRRPMPFSMVAMAALFNLVNGYLNGRYLALFGERYDSGWLTDPRFLFGTALFFTGMIINLRSDGILRRLREGDEPGYKIPRGGMFELVSCANYFGEVRGVDRLGGADLVAGRPDLRPLDGRQPGAPRARPPRVVPPHLPGLPGQPQGDHPVHPVSSLSQPSSTRGREQTRLHRRPPRRPQAPTQAPGPARLGPAAPPPSRGAPPAAGCRPPSGPRCPRQSGPGTGPAPRDPGRRG